MTTDDKDIVSALRAAIAEKVGKERFELWLGSSTRFEFDGRSLTIGVPNRFLLDWVRSNFCRQIDEACVETLGTSPGVTFHIDPSSTNPRAEPARAPRSKERAAEPPRQLRVRAAEDVSVSQPARAAAKSGNGFARRRFASLKSFVAGDSNRLALESARIVAREPGRMTPLLIYGPTAVGKTHLLEGVWSGVRRAHRGVTSIYLSAEQFTTHFLEALRGSGLPSFRRKYRGVGLLIIDDLQFFAGKRATQVELLHTIDTLLRQGHQLVFSADRPPAELAELGSELTTRLEGGMVCPLERPDLATRRGIVVQMACRMKINVPEEVRGFIAARLTSHARELSGALCRLQATSEATGGPITLSMAEEALAEMIRHSGRVVRLGDIERAICNVFGVEPEGLQSNRKTKSVSHPRMLAMWLARKHTRAALSEIGEYFGRRSHSTVVSAQKRVDKWMATGQSVQLADRSSSIDDAIRQVEQQLLAG